MFKVRYLGAKRYGLVATLSALAGGAAIGVMSGAWIESRGVPLGHLAAQVGITFIVEAVGALVTHSPGSLVALARRIRTLIGPASPDLMRPRRDSQPASVSPLTTQASGYQNVEFRTTNGFMYRATRVPDVDEADPPTVRRGFEVISPAGQTSGCTVELSPELVALLRERVRQGPASAPATWDVLCRSALSSYIGRHGTLPASLLQVHEPSGLGHAAIRTLTVQHHSARLRRVGILTQS